MKQLRGKTIASAALALLILFFTALVVLLKGDDIWKEITGKSFFEKEYLKIYAVDTLCYPDRSSAVRSEIPQLRHLKGEDSAVIDSINRQIFGSYGLVNAFESAGGSTPEKQCRFAWEFADDYFVLRFWSADKSYDSVAFDLKTASSTAVMPVPLESFFTLEGWYTFLKKEWFPAVRTADKKAVQFRIDRRLGWTDGGSMEPGGSFADIRSRFSDTAVTIALTRNFAEGFHAPAPVVCSISVPIDSIRPYLSSVGDSLLFHRYHKKNIMEQSSVFVTIYEGLPHYWYLSGLLGKQRFRMIFEINDKKELNGFYYYESYGKTLMVKGRQNGSVIEAEESRNGKVTGKWEFEFSFIEQEDKPIRFHSCGSIVWINPKTGERIPVQNISLSPAKSKQVYDDVNWGE